MLKKKKEKVKKEKVTEGEVFGATVIPDNKPIPIKYSSSDPKEQMIEDIEAGRMPSDDFEARFGYDYREKRK